MGGSLNQLLRVKEEGARRRKLLFAGNKGRFAWRFSCTRFPSIVFLRASMRGNSCDASVIRIVFV